MLASYGIGPGSSPGVLVDRFEIPHTGADKSGQDYSELGVWDNPGVAGPFTGRSASSTATKDVTDTASLSGTEGPIDGIEISTYDSANLTLAEITSLLNHYGVSDTANLGLNELIQLGITGVNAISVSDTASVSGTDASSVGVTVDVSDTASISGTDSGTVDVTREVLEASDTASITANDFATIDAFSGSASFNTSDDAYLRLTESAIAAPVIDTVVESIKFQARVPTIRFRKL